MENVAVKMKDMSTLWWPETDYLRREISHTRKRTRDLVFLLFLFIVFS